MYSLLIVGGLTNCDCLTGFDGDYCEFTPCSSVFCYYGGVCVVNTTLPDLYECNCQPGYMGQRCDVVEDACTLGNKCENDSTCVVDG
jgi:hypothetical protein